MHCPDISFPFGIKDACIACVCEDQISNTFYTVVDAFKANYRIVENSVDNGKSISKLNIGALKIMI